MNTKLHSTCTKRCTSEYQTLIPPAGLGKGSACETRLILHAGMGYTTILHAGMGYYSLVNSTRWNGIYYMMEWKLTLQDGMEEVL